MTEATADSVEQGVADVLRRYLPLVKPGAALPMDTHLQDLGLTSMAAVSLLLDLEQAFGVLIPDALLTQETFRTARSLVRVIASLASSPPPPERAA
jgi:acyl carrier protein